jgi:hypothetical protein
LRAKADRGVLAIYKKGFSFYRYRLYEIKTQMDQTKQQTKLNENLFLINDFY